MLRLISREVCASDVAVARWRSHDFLVVDEVPMLTERFVDVLDAVARTARGVARPFGKLRLGFCGDFFQLPPVGLGGGGVDFAFRARAWSEARRGGSGDLFLGRSGGSGGPFCVFGVCSVLFGIR